jgi:hypothetical protein
MNRRSFLRTCGGGLAAVILVSAMGRRVEHLPEPVRLGCIFPVSGWIEALPSDEVIFHAMHPGVVIAGDDCYLSNGKPVGVTEERIAWSRMREYRFFSVRFA